MGPCRRFVLSGGSYASLFSVRFWGGCPVLWAAHSGVVCVLLGFSLLFRFWVGVCVVGLSLFGWVQFAGPRGVFAFGGLGGLGARVGSVGGRLD